MTSHEPFLRTVHLRPDAARGDRYPFNIPAVAALASGLSLDRVTFFVGENGAGKSTLVEAIAVAAGFNPEGGTVNFNFATRASGSPLHAALKIVRSVDRPRNTFFLRAESFFNVATYIEHVGVGDSYGARSLHEQSHGESFLALIQHRFGPHGLYILDEPEAALSPGRQLTLLRRMHDLVQQGSQFIVATHSPMLMAYPRARIYELDKAGIEPRDYEQLEHVTLTRDFLNDPSAFLEHLFRTKP